MKMRRSLVFKDLDSLYQKFAYAAKRRFELGETNYLEKITAQSKQKQLETQLRQAQNELSISYEKLKPLVHTDQKLIIKTNPLEKLSIESLGIEGNPGITIFIKTELTILRQKPDWKNNGSYRISV